MDGPKLGAPEIPRLTTEGVDNGDLDRVRYTGVVMGFGELYVVLGMNVVVSSLAPVDVKI